MPAESAAVQDLATLGWSAFFAALFEPYAERGLVPARVAVEHRGEYRLYTEQGDVPAKIAGKLRHEATGRADLPAVGD